MTREELIKHWDVIEAFKGGKEIQVKGLNGDWENIQDPSFRYEFEYRNKPQESKKRLPTIKEVQRWFFTNKVFVYKGTGVYERIATFDKQRTKCICNLNMDWLSIDQFCELYTNLDGTELYVTEEKLTYGGKIADFPIEIVERMLDCQVEQGNKRDVSVFEKNKGAGKYFGGFTWSQTKEEARFWTDVIDDKNFSIFFKKYPKK